MGRNASNVSRTSWATSRERSLARAYLWKNARNLSRVFLGGPDAPKAFPHVSRSWHTSRTRIVSPAGSSGSDAESRNAAECPKDISRYSCEKMVVVLTTLALYISPRSRAAASRRWCIHGAFVSKPNRISSSNESIVRTPNDGFPLASAATSCAIHGDAPYRFLCDFNSVLTTYRSCVAHGSLRSCLFTCGSVFSSNTRNTR